jgi:protein TonB
MGIGSRYLIAILSGSLITFLGFSLMIVLIKINQLPVASDNSLENVAFIHVDRERSLNTELAAAPTPPPMPQAPPQSANMQVGDINGGTTGAPKMGSGTGPITDGFALDGVAAGAGVIGGGDYLPIVQVPPPYPPDALKRGIEGWVLVEFVIGAEGEVKSARVVQSEPPGIFDEAALLAARRFRFRPRMVGSVAVEVTGVQNRIRFRLEKP